MTGGRRLYEKWRLRYEPDADDLYAWSARRKCVNCRRPIGEVGG